MKKETLVSIAERSGCSISTVSRVLSGNAAKYRISQRTVARVTEEVKRCNYTPSLLAKGLRTKSYRYDRAADSEHREFVFRRRCGRGDPRVAQL